MFNFNFSGFATAINAFSVLLPQAIQLASAVEGAVAGTGVKVPGIVKMQVVQNGLTGALNAAGVAVSEASHIIPAITTSLSNIIDAWKQSGTPFPVSNVQAQVNAAGVAGIPPAA